jgi:Xaa-Pro dipeptidase
LVIDTRVGQQRIERLRTGMREQGIDALVCMKPQNSFYLSGFNPILYSHPVVAILPLEGEPVLLVHALRDDHAQVSAWVRDIRLHGAWGTKKTMGQDWLAALGSILQERGLTGRTLGIEADFLPIATMQQLEQRLPGARYEDASRLIVQARSIKEPSEIEEMRAAARISDVGMQAALEAAASRGSEREISIQAMAAMNRAWLEEFPAMEVADFGSLEGGVHNGLWCYCLTGDRVSLNCDNPTMRVPAEGELALIIIWTNCNGLHAENERTVAVGQIGDQPRRAYEAVLEIRETSQTFIRPGNTCADVYSAARAAYQRLGYGEYLPGRIGHGIGLGGHEHPSIGPTDQVVLHPGMTLSFEPSLRIPEFGGLQHSDTLVVTDDGFEFLTVAERGFIQI